MFVGFTFVATAFLMIQSLIVWKILKRRYGDLLEYNALEDYDEDDEMINGERHEASNNHQLKPYKSNNGNAVINMNNHEDDESGSEIEFERQTFTSKI